MNKEETLQSKVISSDKIQIENIHNINFITKFLNDSMNELDKNFKTIEILNKEFFDLFKKIESENSGKTLNERFLHVNVQNYNCMNEINDDKNWEEKNHFFKNGNTNEELNKQIFCNKKVLCSNFYII